MTRAIAVQPAQPLTDRLRWLHPMPDVAGIGTCRRMRALRANGHAPQDVARWLDLPVDLVSLLAGGQYDTVPMDTAMTVAARYLELGATAADMDPKLVHRVVRAGWVTSAGWFGVDIDNPAERPLMDPMTSLTVQWTLCAPDVSPAMTRRVAMRLDNLLRTRELTLWERTHVARHLLLAGVTRNRTNMVSGLAPKVVHAMWAYLTG